jgi:hypothetical protein
MMASSISYLTQRTDFKQVDPEVPLTKSRPKDKVDTPKVFGGWRAFFLVEINALVDAFGFFAAL